MYNGLIIMLVITIFKNKYNNISLLDNTFKPIDLNISYTMEKIKILKRLVLIFLKK